MPQDRSTYWDRQWIIMARGCRETCRRCGVARFSTNVPVCLEADIDRERQKLLSLIDGERDADDATTR